MPSKPPQSAAQKKRKRTATKLPGKIAKRFKLKRMKTREEEKQWENHTPSYELESTPSGGLDVEESKQTAKPILQIASQKPVVLKKKGENNRKSRERLRELILL